MRACSPQSSAAASPTASSTPGGSTTGAETPGSASTSTPAPTAQSSGTTTDEHVDCRQVKCIALTYDDGPSAHTAALLDTMARYHAHATFFLIGRSATAEPALVRREQKMSMEIGNHTTDHPGLDTLGEAAVRYQLSDTQHRIEAITHTRPTLMRPPYGAWSRTSNKICRSLGLSVITWDTSPADWENHQASRIAQIVLSQAKPNQIVLMHDTHPWTVAAAPTIMKELSKRGYHMVTVGTLLGHTDAGAVYPRAQ